MVLQIPPDYDFLLHRVTCRSDGPVLLKTEVVQHPNARHPEPQPPQPFTAALEAEYPGHLAALEGETLEDWTKQNADLSQRARAGDDQAFLDLIRRDPRAVGSELTVAKVVSWRTELELFAKYLNLKGSRLFPLTKLEEARAKMEAAKKNLRRLGEVHIAFYDQRGKKPLPPPGVVKGLYYAFLCLFAGLKQEFQLRVTRDGLEKARRDLLALVKALKGVQVQPDSFFIYIAWGVRLLDQLRIGAAHGLVKDNLLNVVGPRSSKPSEVALDLAAQVFEISDHTVETLKESEEIIPWTGPQGEICAVGGRPNFDLASFPEFQAVKRPVTP
ncbi:MAG: hypothetical protein WAP47_14475 [Candidatus Rokuibacteriota bacterium]